MSEGSSLGLSLLSDEHRDLRGLPRILEMKLAPPAQIFQLLMLDAKHPSQ